MVKILGPAVVGFLLACWALFLVYLLGLVRLPDLSRLTLTGLYGGASALGWLAGMVYVQRTRHLSGAPRRRLFLLSFFGPPSLIFLLFAMARLDTRAPLAVLWALCVFGIFYFVPVSFRSVGRDRRV
jgi:hypothetical protein